MSIFSSLCGGLSRKKTPAPDTANAIIPPGGDEAVITNSIESSTATPPRDLENSTDTTQQIPLPPPPGMQRGASAYHFRSASSASASISVSKLSSSLSMRVPGIGLGMRQHSRKEDHHEKKKRDKKLKHDDSIWKKTIILGEKCRVPNDDDDAIVYDENGNRISTYHHRKVPSSLPVSRQTSYIDQDAIPMSQGKT